MREFGIGGVAAKTMNPTLTKIKRLIIQDRYVFTGKADAERIAAI